MRRLSWLPLCSLALGILFAATCIAAASPTPVIVLNENMGTCNQTNGCTISLPFTPTPGQLDLTDSGAVLDVLSFGVANGDFAALNPTVDFASDTTPNDLFDDLADTFGPPPVMSNVFALPEPNVESGPETLFYTPAPGQPGSDPTGAPVTYQITSDSGAIPSGAIPEPSSILLLGTGLLGFAGATRRRLLAIAGRR